MNALDRPDEHIRSVAEHEIAQYHEHGWVHLPHLLSEELAGAIRGELEPRMADRQSQLVERAGHARTARLDAMWRTYEMPSNDIPRLRDFTRSAAMGAVAQALIGHNRGVRCWKDEVFLKLPATAGGEATEWHQDSPYYPMDRVGALTIWIALVEIRPNAGSLRFLSGSHRLGTLGRSFLDDDPLVLAAGELAKLPESPALHLQPGDATAHHLSTVHGAPANSSDAPRWAYTCGYFPADTRYTGAPHRFTDGLGLEPGHRFEHDRFSLVATPTKRLTEPTPRSQPM